MNEPQRLNKVLAASGVASRRACDSLIFHGHVKVNGRVTLKPQTKVNPAVDCILLNNKPLQKAQQLIYFLFHKPRGMLCSHNRQSHKKIIYDSFIHEPSRLFSAGRLDKDTSGLLILSNDGVFVNKVIHPSSNISKEYLVKTNKEITDDHLKQLNEGCMIDDILITPVRVRKVRNGTLKVVVKEGRKHEVRLLVESVGLGIIELKRIRIGNLVLGSLEEGCYRPMTIEEREQIFA